MPGAPPTSPAPFRVADTLELPSVECVTPATATWTFGRRPDEVPAARRGFQLVNEIAQRWGFLRERTGTCVWFELAPED
jgi:hypothetical protein